MVERVLAKHEVVGSKPITRSNKICNEINCLGYQRVVPTVRA